MWKEIVSLFRSEGPLQEAYDEAILMLVVSQSMYKDAVSSLHKDGGPVTDIYERDRQINKYERSVRRKIVTHMSVSTKPDINLGLVLTAIVIDIERIGDYTKNIVELAAGVEGRFDGLELHADVLEIEGRVNAMFDSIIPGLENSDQEIARKIIEAHVKNAETIDRDIVSLTGGQVLAGRAGHAVTVALYLRYLKRVSAHLKNVATSIVNPYHRIGFREKGREGDEA